MEDFHIDTGVWPSSLAVIYPSNAPSEFLPSYIRLKHIGLRYAKECSLVAMEVSGRIRTLSHHAFYKLIIIVRICWCAMYYSKNWLTAFTIHASEDISPDNCAPRTILISRTCPWILFLAFSKHSASSDSKLHLTLKVPSPFQSHGE